MSFPMSHQSRPAEHPARKSSAAAFLKSRQGAFGKLMAMAGLLAAGSAIALSGIWLAGQATFAPLRESLSPGAMTFNPLTGKVSLRDIMLREDGINVRVGEIVFSTSYAMLTPAFAAESFSLKNVTIDTAGFNYRAPTIDIAGASVSQKDMSGYIDKSSAKPFADLLATLSASSISVPEATIEIGSGASKRVLELKAVVMRDIASGKAEVFTAASGSLKGPSPVDGKFGVVNGRAIDLAVLAQVMAERPPPLDKTLFAQMTADKLQFRTAGGQLVVERLSSANVKVPQRGGAVRTLPALGTFSLEGVTMDVARANAPSAKWTMKKLTLTADGANDGVPTRFIIAGDTLSLAIPANATDPTYKNLVDLGYSALVFSVNAEGNWMPANNDFVVKEVAFRGDDIGVIGISAVLGKVSRDFFLAEQKAAQEAAKAVTVKSLGVNIENRGLFERIVAREARKSGRSIEEARRQLTAATAVSAAGMTATTPGAEAVKAALLKFLNRPGKLRVTMKTKETQGILISEFRDPAAQKRLAEKVEISATAE